MAKKKKPVAAVTFEADETETVEKPDTTRAVSKFTHHCSLVNHLVDEIGEFLAEANQDAEGNAAAIKAAKSVLADAATKIDELIQ